MTNLEAAAESYAQAQQRKYVAKRGGKVPWQAAFNVYVAAYNDFMRRPEAFEPAA